MRILLVESTRFAPTNPLFLDALKELAQERGFEWSFFDEAPFTNQLVSSLVHKVAFRLLGRRPLTYWAMNRALLRKAREFRPNVVLILKGAFFSLTTLHRLKEDTKAILVNYATDDPFNPRVNSRDLVATIPLYDLYVCTKRAIMDDVRKSGCSRVTYVPFGYKPSVHFPEKPATPEEQARFNSHVVFIGNCDADRIPYFEALVRALPDIELHLYGGYWDRHPVLRRYYRGFARGRDYRLALGAAKIAINLVRRSNRDGHVMRTFEIPACGAFMLAERTEEHLELFREDKEATFFSSPEELVEKVQYYLAHDAQRERIAKAGYQLVTNNLHSYKDRLVQILRTVDA